MSVLEREREKGISCNIPEILVEEYVSDHGDSSPTASAPEHHTSHRVVMFGSEVGGASPAIPASPWAPLSLP